MTKHRICCRSLFVSLSLGALAACAAGDPPAGSANDAQLRNATLLAATDLYGARRCSPARESCGW